MLNSAPNVCRSSPMPVKISDRTPGEKLLALYTLLMLQGDQAISLSDLASSLMCSKQTVLRLLNQLEASGYGKLEEPVRRGRQDFYRLAKSAESIINVGARELAQLALCRNFLLHLLPAGSSFPLNRDSAKDQGGGDSPASIMYKGYIDYAPFENQYNLLLQATQKKLVCRVNYRKSIFSPPREFFFAPMRLVSYHETISFLGWEVTARGAVKKLYDNWLWLYLQRCLSVVSSKRSSAGLEGIEIQSGKDAEFGIMDREEFKVKLLFNAKTANYIQDRHWAVDQKISLTREKGLILEMTARSKPEVLSWVLSFGANVKVLEPDWLRVQLVSSAKNIIATNQSGEALS